LAVFGVFLLCWMRQIPLTINISGYGFHELGGHRKGTYSVRVTSNWRLTFQWDGADATHVDLEDCH